MESYATKNTTAQLTKTRRKDIRMRKLWRIRWKERSSSRTTPKIVDEMMGQRKKH